MHLTTNEDSELNVYMPTARDLRLGASAINAMAGTLAAIPDLTVNLEYWGLGASMLVFGGSKLAESVRTVGEVIQAIAAFEGDQGAIAGRTAQHERRADDWLLQANLAARELAHFGRQIIGSMIAEQVAHHEYLNVQKQIEDSQEVQAFLQSKFTNEELHLWMQGEISRLYYQWYRFALDTARKAEQTMKLELRRPEIDETEYVRANYWDVGRKGLLSGEALHLDVRRLETAYHDNNRRELELTRHVSLRQLDPLALLQLKTAGSATFEIPEWLYDRDFPGHYMRRIKTLALSVPSVVGPYTPVPCTLSLLSSKIRTSPYLANERYAETPSGDDRFVELFGPAEQIATSSGTNDAGMFETNLHDERWLPFEGAGAISCWEIELPRRLRSFDYSTIADVILHVRYTARAAGEPLEAHATSELEEALSKASESGLTLLFSMRHDFPSEWAAFTLGTGELEIALGKEMFPYLAQGRTVTLDPNMRLYAGTSELQFRTVATPATASEEINGAEGKTTLQFTVDPTVLTRTASDVFLILGFALG